MFNYVNRVLIGKSAGANTGTSLPTITAGDILFINGNTGAVLTATTIAAVSDTTPIYAAMGLALGKVRLSSPIRRKEIRKVTRQPYRAKAEQMDDVTITLVAGKHYRLTVVLKDEFRIIANRQTKLEIPDFVATGDDAADAAKLAALVTKAKSTYGILSGSVVSGKLRITGLPVAAESVLDEYQFVAFSTAFHQLDEVNPGVSQGTAQTVTTVQKADGGSGLPAQLTKIEREASGYLGNTDLRNFDRLPNASLVSSTGTYDILHIMHFDKHQGDHEFSMESPVQTTFFTQSGSTLSTFVETMVEAFVTKTASPVLTDGVEPDADSPDGLAE